MEAVRGQRSKSDSGGSCNGGQCGTMLPHQKCAWLLLENTVDSIRRVRSFLARLPLSPSEQALSPRPHCRIMRKLALAVLLLPLAACHSFTWTGHGTGLSAEQRQNGIKDVTALSNKYETETFFKDVRRRIDGRNNAFGRDLMAIQDFIDQYFWNYDANDPAVNYPSNTTKFEHFGRFTLITATSLPPVDELTSR